MSTSDYRGTSVLPQTQVPNQMHYSRALQTSRFPKKDQAIVLSHNEDLKLTDYVTAVARIIEPKNILFVSRISNNRICIYLSNVDLVDTVISHGDTIKINNLDVGIRRLITPAKRIILSNVCPTIPHSILEDEIRKLGLKTASPMSFLRASLTGQEFAHILSFRRQIYVQPDDIIELPSSVVIQYEETQYRIFLSYDSLVCFQCKEKGHVAKHCPQNETLRETAEINNTDDTEGNHLISGPLNQPTNDEQETVSRDLTLLQTTSATEIVTTVTSASKRPPSPSSCSGNSSQVSETLFKKPDESSMMKHTNKKPKTASPTEKIPLDILMEPIKQAFLEVPESLNLNYEQITNFFDNVKGCKDIVSLASTYTDDLTGLLKTLHTIYPYFQNRGIKHRCTTVQRKIRKELGLVSLSQGYDTNSDSESSTSSHHSSHSNIHPPMEH